MKISKQVWSALALSVLLSATAATAVAQPPADAPKGENPPNTNRGQRPRDRGQRGNRPDGRIGGPGARFGTQARRSPLMTLNSEQLQEWLGKDLTDAQKAQLAGAAEERDQAMKAAEERFRQQVMQATGLSEQAILQKIREQRMQNMRNVRPDGPNRERPNRERPNRERPNRERPNQDEPGDERADNDEA